MMNLRPMALQRILESARKLGVPVIITDVAGRDPFVILPLEQFEAMAGVEGKEMKQESIKSIKPVPSLEGELPEPTTHFSLNEVQREILPKIEEKEAKPEIQEVEENPLEERFYLEPMDEGEQGG